MEFLKKNKIRIFTNALVVLLLALTLAPSFAFGAASPICRSRGVPFSAGWCLCPCCVGDKPCDLLDFFALMKSLIDAMLYASFFIMVIMIIWGGFKILMAQENAGKMTEGKDMVKWAVYGALIAFGAWLIIDTILSTFTSEGLGGWTSVFN